MRLHLHTFASLLAVSVLMQPGAVNATPITGVANIAGNVTVSSSSVLFTPAFTSAGSSTETGAFSGLTSGTIQSLTGGPLTGDTFVSRFIAFDGGVAQPVFFDLNYIAPGVGSSAACSSSGLGSVCTPTGSPFSLFQLSSNTVVAALQLNGNSYTGSPDTGVSFTTSILTTQIVLNGTVPDVVRTLQNGGSLEGITYSASLEATPPIPIPAGVPPTIPEPATVLLMGIGLVAAGLVARARMRD